MASTGSSLLHRGASAVDPTVNWASVREQFPGGRHYLNACTMGLPSRAMSERMLRDHEAWVRAEVGPNGYGEIIERTRWLYARLVGAPVAEVAIGSQASVFAAMLAASLPDSATVLVPDGEFSSIVFPFLVQQPRIRVVSVPLARLAEKLDDSIDMVVFSLVQSADGVTADAEAIRAQAAAHGVTTVCDTTQAAGTHPLRADQYDVTICSAYKWLLCPRGVAFMTIAREQARRVSPIAAGWYAGRSVWDSMYGPNMDLAEDGRRFDVSPAWPCWPAAEVALAMLDGIGVERIYEENHRRAAALRHRLGLPEDDSCIVAWSDPEGADFLRLTRAGLKLSCREGHTRLSFHLWNDDEDLHRILEALEVAG